MRIVRSIPEQGIGTAANWTGRASARQPARASQGNAVLEKAFSRRALYKPAALLAAAASMPVAVSAGTAEETDSRIRSLTPELEHYVASGMADFDVPGIAVGIVAGDQLV